MAKQLNVNLAFTADTSQAKAQLQQLQNQLNSLVKGQGISDSHLGITQEIREGINAAAQLKVQLEAATNINTGKLDLNKFSRSLRQSGMDLKTYAKQLEQLGPAGTDAFLSLSRAISNAEAPLVRINKHVAQLGTTLVNTIRWQFSSSLIHSLQSGVQTIIRYTEDLNESLNNIRIVTGQSTEQMAKFAKEANKAAKALSTTTVEYTDAALIFYQQGLSDEEVKKRTDITVKMANVAGESVETVSDQLTAVWNNFYDGTKALEYYADVMTALGAATASSVDEISGGLEKFAAIGGTIGLSFEYAASALATITSNTRQSEEVVGTALKTIFARIQGLKLGETLDDGTNLNKYSEALAKVGISIFESNGELKAMDNILYEMAVKWNSLNNAQQTALAQTVAGVRQYTQVVALMENWDNGDSDSMMANLDTSYGATGALQEQADIYAESWGAAADRVKASAESIYDALLNDEAIIDLMDGFSGFLDLINTFINALGGVPGLLALVSTAALKLASPQISNGIYNLVEGTKEFFNINGARDAANQQRFEAWNIAKKMKLDEFSAVGLVSVNHIEQEAKIQESLLKNADKLTEEQRRKYSYQLDTLRALQEENKRSAQTLDTLQAQNQEYQTKLKLSRSLNLNEVVGSKNISGQSQDITRENAINDYLNAQKIYGTFSYHQNQINSSLDQIPKANEKGAISSVKDLKTFLGSIQSYIPEGNLNDQLNTIFSKLNHDQNGKALNGRLSLKTLYAGKTTKNYDFTDYGNTFFKEVQKFFQDLEKELIEQVKKAGKQATDNLEEGDIKRVEEAGEGAFQEGRIEAQMNQQNEDLDKYTQETLNDINKSIEAAGKWSDTLVKTAGDISYFTMGLMSLTSAFESFSNGIKEGTLSANDILSVFMSLGMAIPMLLNSITALTDGTKLGSIVTAIHAKIKRVETKVLMENAEAQKAANLYLTLAIIVITALITILKAVIKTRKEAQESIQDSINKYQEEKDKLDELNNSLEETKNRIKELSEQDSLTLIEQEELDKLKLSINYLERQKELQELSTKVANEEKVEDIADNYSKAYRNLIRKTNNYVPTTDDTIEELYRKEGNVAAINAGANIGGGSNITYNRGEGENVSAEKLEQYQQSEEAYFELVTAKLVDGIDKITDEELANIQQILSDNRKGLYTDAEYKTKFIDPLFDTVQGDYSADAIYDVMTSDSTTKREEAEDLISEGLQNELLTAGVSVTEFLDLIEERTSGLKEKFKDIQDVEKTFEEETKDFTSEDWDILASLNIENIETAEELWAALEKYRKTSINVEVAGIDGLTALIDELNTSQKPLESALSTYKDQSYLTMDQAYELISENSEYAKYLVYDEINNRYKLIGQTLTDFQNLEAKERDALNELISLQQEQQGLNKDYLNEYIGMLGGLQDLTNSSLSGSSYEALAKVAEDYKAGNLSTSEYLGNLEGNVNNLLSDFEKLNDQIENEEETTDEWEASLSATTGLITNGLVDLNNEFNRGTITMKEYYDGTIKGTNALIKTYSGLYKDIVKLDEATGEWKLTAENTTENLEILNKMNLWQEQLTDAEGLLGVVGAITDNYDYLVDNANAFGQIDFTIDNNFSTTAQEFQDMCSDIGESLMGLEDTNEESFKNILKYVQSQNFELANGLDTTTEELIQAMSENSELAAATVNACMMEAEDAITSASQAAGTILTELGNLIQNFDYTLTFSIPKEYQGGLLKRLLFGEGGDTLSQIRIEGSAGEEGSVANFVSALSSAADYFSSQGSAYGQGGIFNYGYEDFDNSALDPNSIITDNLNSSGDDAFDRLQKKLEFKLKIDTDELEKLEYLLNKFSDEFYLLGESAEHLLETIDHRENILSIHEDHIADLTAAYNAGQISAEDYNSGLNESKEAIYEQLNALLDLDKQMREYYGNTLDEADEELEDLTDHLEHLSKVFDHYVNLMDIFGKSKDYEAMDNFLQGRADIIKEDLDTIETYYDGLIKEKDEVEKLLADAAARGDEEAKELYEIMLNDISDKIDETQDQMLEMTEEWAEAMKKVFENTFNKLSDELEKALTDGMGFDSMLNDFDLLNQQQEEFLTKTNQIYETNKLMRTATKAMDDTSNKAAKQKIKNYIEETKKLQNTTRLSKYELEIQQAKYDLLLAQIALEEAQNAKSTVRLTRDNEGNFGYIYTADQDEVDDAQQQLEDAQNNLYNIQYEGQQNALTKYIEALQNYYNAQTELQEQRADGIIASDEELKEKQALLEDRYFGPMGVLTELSRLYNITLQENTNATAENLLNQYGFMTDGVEQHANLVQQYIEEMDVAWADFQTALTLVHNEVQTTLSNSAQATEDLKKEGEELAESIKNNIIPAIHNEIEEVRLATSAYGLQRDAIQSLIDKYEDYIDTLKEVTAAEASVGGSSAPSTDNGLSKDQDNITSYEKTAVDEMWDRHSNPTTNYYTPAGDTARSAEAAEKQRNVLVPTYNYKNGKFTKSLFGSINSSFIDNDGKGSPILEVKDGYFLVGTGAGQKWIKSSDILRGFDTGGYTGDWGPEGKLAMLHEKELVLNAADTSNILSAVSIIREIARDIDARASMSNLSLLTSAIGVHDTNQVLEQMVSIEASFPNATDRYEIEEAFNSLVNKAAQYANRK